MKDWTERTTRSGSHRWSRNMWPNKPVKPHVWLCVGNDGGGRREHVAVWGGSTLDKIEWHFGSWCKHPLDRGLEFADEVARAIESRPRVASGSWDNERQGFRRSLGDLNLAVSPWNSLLTNGNHVSGIYEGYEPRDNEELVDLWRWWLDIPYPDRGIAWAMKSWPAFRNPEVAMAHAERIAQSLVDMGFDQREVLQ